MNFKLMVALSVVIFISACSKESPAPVAQKTIPELASIQLSVQTTTQEVKYDGVIEAINQATVSAQTSGRIVEIPVDVGDYVAKGDLIMRFTDTEQKARVASAQRNLPKLKRSTRACRKCSRKN